MSKTHVSIIGGSGYAGGELLRILLGHPNVEVKQVTSQRFAKLPVTIAHPNLRKVTDLRFARIEDIEKCDLLIVALPNGESMKRMKEFMKLAPKIIDLGADFRLRKAKDYKEWYGWDHCCPELLKEFVYGAVELHRDEIKKANYVAGVGCEAYCSILGLYPLFKNKLIEGEVFIDAKLGSSAAGNKPTPGSHHPERSGCVRSYKATGHRHTAEIKQELNFGKEPKTNVSATAIEMVRGILVTAQTSLKENLDEKDVWKVYRKEYGDEPFVRIVKERTGIFRYPEPKLLQGTNFCDVGFEKEEGSNRLVVISAIDNLCKGTAGVAVQCMNLMFGWEERTGLEFPGLHPV